MRIHFIHGNIYQTEGRFVEALAIEGGVIVAAGTNDEIQSGGSPDEIVNLQGRTVLPGLNDSHMHLASIGSLFRYCDVGPARSIDELVEIGRAFVEAHPDFPVIYGRGWNHDYFIEGEHRMPDRHDLDRISTEVPIVLRRVCGHVATGNSLALERLGITAETRVDGGEIELDADGVPNGRFNENAIALLETVLPPLSLKQRVEDLLRGAQEAVSFGITSVQSNDPYGDEATPMLEALHHVVANDLLPLRYSVQVNYDTPDELNEYIEREVNNGADYDERWFRRGVLKLFRDGSLGSRTAEMIDDYADDPDNRGVIVIPQDTLNALVVQANAAHIPVAVHAIGDGAVEAVLHAFEHADLVGSNPIRNGIIHCQITNQSQLDRIVERNISVYYQPIFLDYDLKILDARAGADLGATSYAFGSMIRRGAHVSFGTDAPVESCNPFPNIACAVTRQTLDGFPEGGYAPEERISVEEAVDAYTRGSAWAEGTEEWKGALLPGFAADLTVIDRDIFSVPEEEIAGTVVLQTMIDGEWVYTR